MKQRKIFVKQNKNIKHNNIKLFGSKKILIKTKKHLNKSKNSIIHSKAHKKSMCAPFIQPMNLSKNHGIDKNNVKLIKTATDETCFTLESLRKLATKWNQSHPNMIIEFDNNTSGKSIWNSLNNVMKAKCNNEVCWIKQDFIKNSSLSKELLNHFKPIMPKKWDNNPIEWLNTLDIRDVMRQYEVKYPKFEFIGPVPMDFDAKIGFGQCVINELCKIQLSDLLSKGKNKLGVIFNLDKHTQSGSHWVAMYANFPENNNTIGEICYWDSYGIKPNKEVVILMKRLKKQANELDKKVIIKLNNFRHQYKNSECGIYCIYFITSLLEGQKFENIVQNIIPDDAMNTKRKDYFVKVD
jgi:hypothetical protein